MKPVLKSAALWMALAGAALAAAPAQVRIAWEYKDIAATVQLYEVKGRPRLWETASVKALADAPVAGRVESDILKLAPGEARRFALVVRNDSDKTLYFFAAPHQAYPVEHSLGFKFKCLCTNHAYSVGPRQTWYRIVELRLDDGFVGDTLTITHTLIGIDAQRARAFAQQPAMPDM